MATNYALIADADLVAAHVYLSSVREHGLATAVARDGGAALSTLRERGAPSLLIIELSLTVIDGFELIEGFRRTVPETRTPVIVVSADRDLRDRAHDLRARLGIGAVMARAASEESVKRVIRLLLGIPEDSARRPKPGAEAPPVPAPTGVNPRMTPPLRIRAGRV